MEGQDSCGRLCFEFTDSTALGPPQVMSGWDFPIQPTGNSVHIQRPVLYAIFSKFLKTFSQIHHNVKVMLNIFIRTKICPNSSIPIRYCVCKCVANDQLKTLLGLNTNSPPSHPTPHPLWCFKSSVTKITFIPGSLESELSSCLSDSQQTRTIFLSLDQGIWSSCYQ